MIPYNISYRGRLRPILKYDVVVVGAGPAGSTAAKFLAEKGVKVLLIDKDKYPREKLCGGGISLKTLKRFNYIPEDLIDSYCYGGKIYSSSLRYIVQVQKEEPIGAYVLRKTFDDGLAKLAVESKATFMDGTKAVNLNILPDKAEVVLNNGKKIESQLVIGADGTWSVIAKKSGLRHPSPPIGLCIVHEYPLPSNKLDQYFTEKKRGYLHIKIFGIAGYGWVFPKKNHVNIGIGEMITPSDLSRSKKNLRELYTQYFQLLKKHEIIPPTLKIGKLQGAALPTRPLEQTFSDRVVLCGDAGGLINPLTGDGIEYAMVSGQLAAKVCGEALEESDTSAAFLSLYQRLWQKDFGGDIKLMLRAQKGWTTDSEKAVRLLARDKKLAEIGLDVMMGNLSFSEGRWRLMRRALVSYIRNLFMKAE